MVRLVVARWLRDHVVRIEFDDGVRGKADLAGHLHGEVFEPLRDVDLFLKVRYDDSLRTVVWPNGADLAPEFLRGLLTTGKQRHELR